MIQELWEQIQNGQEVRQNLSKIRQVIKDNGERRKLSALLEGEETVLIDLLRSEDAKTRKNAALLMGDLRNPSFLAPIWKAYQEDGQRFVKSSYLSAIGNFDYREYMDAIKEQLAALEKEEVTEENQKHLMEEMRKLSFLIVHIEGGSAHKFIGWDKAYDIFLITNRNYRELVGNELMELEPKAKIKLMGAGVMARVTNLNWIKGIRTYQELLFVVRGMETSEMDPDKSIASYALRWVGSHSNVKVILSGMSTMQQVEDNLKTFIDFSPLSDEEENKIKAIVEELRSRVQNGCTGCRYCMPCPAGVNIPGNFQVWNRYHMYRTYDHVKGAWEKELKDEEKAKNCIKCGKCEALCPQKLSIRDNLVQVQKDLDERIFA